ncbi:MAG: rod shape-determining protein MreD [Deltaproteobacteria bacterium]|nr:rod shape-determining protein MreD [Deltaproteobacteria bacterium]
MRYCLSLPFVILMAAVLQTSLLNRFLPVYINCDVLLIGTVCAALRFPLERGLLWALLSGFVHDCLTVPFPGMYIFIYPLIFLAVKILSARTYTTNPVLIALFVFAASVLASLFLWGIYRLVGDDATYCSLIVGAVLAQSLTASIASPFAMTIVERYESFSHAEAT